MNWGHKIIIAFAFFGVFIITLVVVCVRQDFHLVSTDYYQKELEYETEIIHTQNAMSLEVQPQLQLTKGKGQLDLIFPLDLTQQLQSGELVFFRPSDAKKDFRVPLALDLSGHQAFDVSSLAKGFWRVELSWKDKSKSYYIEKKVFL